jgi:hypothetical protein
MSLVVRLGEAICSIFSQEGIPALLNFNPASSQLHIIPHVIPSGDEGHFPSSINHFPFPFFHHVIPSSLPRFIGGDEGHFPSTINHFPSTIFHFPSFIIHPATPPRRRAGIYLSCKRF